MKWSVVTLVCLLTTTSVYGMDRAGGEKRRLIIVDDAEEGPPKKKLRLELSEEEEASAQSSFAGEEENEEEDDDADDDKDMDGGAQKEEASISEVVRAHQWAKAQDLKPHIDFVLEKRGREDLKNYKRLPLHELIIKLFPRNPYQLLEFESEISLVTRQNLRQHLDNHYLALREARLLWVLSWESNGEKRGNLIHGAIELHKHDTDKPSLFLQALLIVHQTNKQNSGLENPFQDLYIQAEASVKAKKSWRKVENKIIKTAQDLARANTPASLYPQSLAQAFEVLPFLEKDGKNSTILAKRQEAAYGKFHEAAKNFLTQYEEKQAHSRASQEQATKRLQGFPPSTAEPYLVFSYPKPETIDGAKDLRVPVRKMGAFSNLSTEVLNRVIFPKNPYQIVPTKKSSGFRGFLSRYFLGAREHRLLVALGSIEVVAPPGVPIDEGRAKILIDQEVRNILQGAALLNNHTKVHYQQDSQNYLDHIQYLYNYYGTPIFPYIYQRVHTWKKQEGMADIRDFVYALYRHHQNKIAQDNTGPSLAADSASSTSSSSSSTTTTTTTISSSSSTTTTKIGSTPSSSTHGAVAASSQVSLLQQRPYTPQPSIGFQGGRGAPFFSSAPGASPSLFPPPTLEQFKQSFSPLGAIRAQSAPFFSGGPLTKAPQSFSTLSSVASAGSLPSFVVGRQAAAQGNQAPFPHPWAYPPVSEDEKIIERFFMAAPYKIVDKLFVDINAAGNELEFDALNQFYGRNGWVNHPLPGEKRVYNWTKIFRDWMRCRLEESVRADLLTKVQQALAKELPGLTSKQKVFYEQQIVIVQGLAAAYEADWLAMPASVSGFLEIIKRNLQLSLKNLELEEKINARVLRDKQNAPPLRQAENG